MLEIKKKDGKLEGFNFGKIKGAVTKSAQRVNKTPTEEFWEDLAEQIRKGMPSEGIVTVEFMHRLVQASLHELDAELYGEYARYRDYKIVFNKQFQELLKRTMQVIYEGDKENANKNSALVSTLKEIVGGLVSEVIALEYELPKEIAVAHKKGAVYYHDLRDYIFGSINCCLFDIASVFKGGFTNNGVGHSEPNHIGTAFTILGNVILCASSQQFGGFTIPEIDTALSPYAEKQYNQYLQDAREYAIVDPHKFAMHYTCRDIRQGYESIEYMLNTTNNALGQTPFVTFTFGLDTSFWGREITKAMLSVRHKGLGTAQTTAIFPKLVFLHRQEVNGAEDSPNYDIKRLALECTLRRIYPDWLSLDAGYLGHIYTEYGKAISPMGCRAFLSPWYERGGMYPVDDTDSPVYIGRANCGAISIILPHIALESGGDIRKFYNLLDEYMDIAKDAHLYKYDKLKKKKASSNPLFFCEGGCHVKLQPDDTIEEAIKTFTWSFGYIGLDEVTRYFRGVGIDEDNSLAVEILQYMSNKLEQYKKETGLLFALYGTPAEGLCGKALMKDREQFGIVKGVTDKGYYTNSFHENVGIGSSALVKQDTETPMFHISSGGRIVYNEFPRTDNVDGIEAYVNHAMDNGLYYGVNFQLDTCRDCKTEGEFETPTCPNCGSTNVVRINRVCGYLGIYEDGGETRYNQGKINEVSERKDNI